MPVLLKSQLAALVHCCVFNNFWSRWLIAMHLDVISFVPSLMMSILIAMSIDYSLFLLTRYTEALRNGHLHFNRRLSLGYITFLLFVVATVLPSPSFRKSCVRLLLPMLDRWFHWGGVIHNGFFRWAHNHRLWSHAIYLLRGAHALSTGYAKNHGDWMCTFHHHHAACQSDLDAGHASGIWKLLQARHSPVVASLPVPSIAEGLFDGYRPVWQQARSGWLGIARFQCILAQNAPASNYSLFPLF